MRKHLILSVAALVALTTACNDDFLTVESNNQKFLEEYFSTEPHLHEALIAAYDPLEWFDWASDQYNPINIMSDIMADQIWVGGSDKTDNEGQHLRWSAKNIQEQRYVASYLADVLRRFSDDVCEEGPRTVRAAHLVHLRSDFTFSLDNKRCTRIGKLLEALHPTPAVCGLPKDEAQRFIISHEHHPRHYYSGFMGPFNVNEDENENVDPISHLIPHTSHFTHLYVSLRCMHITDSAYHLYAGGGLLRESNEQQEWQETEAKMDTMRRLLLTQSSQQSQSYVLQ